MPVWESGELKMTPAEVFWATAFLVTLLTRLLADYAKVRLHVRGVHIHHFVWGILSAFLAILALYYGLGDSYLGLFLAGIAVALISSEAKELVLSRWSR